MPSHPIDFQINPNVFSKPQLAQIFDEKARYQRWLDFEAALAKVQGDMGLIPREAAEEIGRKAKLECLDLEAIHNGYLRSRNSLMPLIDGLRKACGNDYGEYVHYGVTTQDVLDTSEILELRETLALVYKDLRALELVCLDLARRYRSTPLVARTHGQQALPTTFGFKVAIWLGETRRHIERLKNIFHKIGFGQLSGAVGTMAALGPHAMEVAKRTLGLMGLKHSNLAWHNSRDTIGELASIFSLLVTSLAKMANEIFQLQKTEIGELKERGLEGAVASTTMPHKTNPVICERVVVLARHVRYLTGTIVESMVHEHERDPRCLWAEWLAMPQLCIYTGTALRYMLDVMAELEVDSNRMMENLRMQRAAIMSEWLVFRLSREMGKIKALEKLRELARKATEAEASLRETVVDDLEIGPLLTSEDMECLDHPEKYIGHAVEIVDHTVQEIESKRASDPKRLGGDT